MLNYQRVGIIYMVDTYDMNLIWWYDDMKWYDMIWYESYVVNDDIMRTFGYQIVTGMGT